MDFKKQAQELVAKMTISERAAQLRYNAPAIERLGIPAYNWWNEALHGVARAGTATMFPQAIGMAATFDEELIHKAAEIIAKEGRAKYNAYSAHGDRDIYKGLTFWSPNINIFRDPRWGRGHETYGEDPHLTARLGVAFVKGLQGTGKYLKAAACAKHFAVHSGPESVRHEFNAEVSQKDLWETYLPAFESLVKEAKVEAIMGAYNRTNGEPCCGSSTLLKDILRKKWAFAGHVTSDCWAIKDFHKFHHVTNTMTESVAMALNAGCDVNCGDAYTHIMEALDEKLLTEEVITQSCERLFETRFKLGLFDADCDYNRIPYEENDCAEHNALALEISRRSLVLLKNDSMLPLKKENLKTLAVIGPTADSREVLKGNYFGTASKYITILDGIQRYLENSPIRVMYSEGCHLYKDRCENLAYEDDRFSEAVMTAEKADAIILCLGLDASIEGEEGDAGNKYAGGDKPDLHLAGRQQQLLETLIATGKPVILLLSTGSAMAIEYADKYCKAVVQTWYCGARGGQAVAEMLFGEFSPSGKLPVTFYRSTDDLPPFEDYSMKNRTYRYFTGKPLYPFGHGLSYTTFAWSNLTADSVTVENTGICDAYETVQVYCKIKDSAFAPPNGSLCFFKPVFLKKGEKKTVRFTLNEQAYTVVNNEGMRIRDGSGYELSCGGLQFNAKR